MTGGLQWHTCSYALDSSDIWNGLLYERSLWIKPSDPVWWWISYERNSGFVSRDGATAPCFKQTGHTRCCVSKYAACKLRGCQKYSITSWKIITGSKIFWIQQTSADSYCVLLFLFEPLYIICDATWLWFTEAVCSFYLTSSRGINSMHTCSQINKGGADLFVQLVRCLSTVSFLCWGEKEHHRSVY